MGPMMVPRQMTFIASLRYRICRRERHPTGTGFWVTYMIRNRPKTQDLVAKAATAMAAATYSLFLLVALTIGKLVTLTAR